jgi:hypothetical protein
MSEPWLFSLLLIVGVGLLGLLALAGLVLVVVSGSAPRPLRPARS